MAQPCLKIHFSSLIISEVFHFFFEHSNINSLLQTFNSLKNFGFENVLKNCLPFID